MPIFTPAAMAFLTLFCPNSEREEKRMMGFFSLNWWSRTFERRA
jgi:hypothetical protein